MMIEKLDDLAEYMTEPADLEKYFERTASIEEVNGEMLQTLSRIYRMTGDKKYYDWERKLVFDTPRHKTILNLPLDYLRINQFPE